MRMKRHTRPSEHGYSLAELLTVVSILGVVTLISVPALFQLMPQYRIRGAASEFAATLRAARQKAVTTRSAWRVTINADTNAYAVAMFTGTVNDDLTDAANWTWADSDYNPGLASPQWRKLPEATDLLLDASNTFKDVVCPAGGGRDAIFLATGTVSDAPDCGDPATDVLEFDPEPAVTLSIDNTWVRFNRYDISTRQSGAVVIEARKE
jgi:prepilin-type N-terminal cleavage/methylation domain-containing protein